MGKWLIAVGCVAVAALIGLLLWQLSSSPKPTGSAPALLADPASRATPTRVRSDAGPRIAAKPATDARAAAVPLDGLAADHEALQDRVDVVIPEKIRELAAVCYDGGLDPDLTIKVNYRLRVLAGKLFTTNVHIENSELGDHPELERCIVDAVEKAEWRDDDMPDFDEDEELFIRLMTLEKYKNRGEGD